MSEKGPQLDFAQELLEPEAEAENPTTKPGPSEHESIGPEVADDKSKKKATRTVRDPSDGSTYEVPL